MTIHFRRSAARDFRWTHSVYVRIRRDATGKAIAAGHSCNVIQVGTSRCDVPARKAGGTNFTCCLIALNVAPLLRGADGAARRPYLEHYGIFVCDAEAGSIT
jgi:hypothetical protein